MTDFARKYKDRDPLETVNIVYTFFTKQGYILNVARNEKTEADTFWCHLELLDKNNSVILTSNGKGASPEYSLASGHAELYERYCAGFAKKEKFTQYQENFKHTGFYIDEKEQFLNFEEIKNSNPVIQSFFNILDDKNHYVFKDYLNNFGMPQDKETIPCVPFINLNNSNELYLNPEMLNFIQGSDGLAAGNTIEEAIVQAMSEIYEHYATDKLYYNNSSEIIYYQLNLHKMKSVLPEYLNNIIDKIEAGGYHLMVYDLSYNFNVPVLAAIIIDSYHVAHLNLGAAPVFNIALERTLTEIYQGRIKFKINECNKYYMKPYRTYTIAQSAYTNISSITLRDNYPEELLLNKINVSDYNHQIFLEDNSYSNNDLLSYYLKLNNMNNFEIYIRDLSQIQEIRAIRLFCANQIIFPWKHDIYKLISLETRLKIQNIAYELNFKEEFCSDNYFALLNQLEEIFQDDTIDNTAKNEYLSFIFKDEMKIFPVSNLDKFFIYYDNLILNTDDESVLKYNYYKSLYLYKKSNKYTDKEISNIFIHGLKYSVQSQIDEDLKNILDYKYVIRKILKGEKE